jgi:hypothetical protein
MKVVDFTGELYIGAFNDHGQMILGNPKSKNFPQKLYII